MRQLEPVLFATIFWPLSSTSVRENSIPPAGIGVAPHALFADKDV